MRNVVSTLLYYGITKLVFILDTIYSNVNIYLFSRIKLIYDNTILFNFNVKY